ncbi:MAG: hypothetical protein AAF570_01065, partial [Bacteroidota bacterium]
PPSNAAAPSDPNTTPDPGLGAEIVDKGRALVRARNFAALRDLYVSHQGDDRTILLEGVCKQLGNSDALETWALQSPKDAVATLFAGTNYCFQAFEARGGRLAKDVQGGQWALFGKFLSESAKMLEASIAADPSDAEPYHRMIRVLLGDNALSTRSYMDYFEEARRRRPHHLYAHMDALTHKCEKWGGSHHQMFTFARESLKNAPDGTLLATLIPMANIERMVYYRIENDVDGANNFLRSENAKAELHDAYMKSVGSPNLEQTPLTPVLYNWMAANLIYSASKVGRQETLQRMGNQITDRPWAYISMPVYGHVNDLRKDFRLPPI